MNTFFSHTLSVLGLLTLPFLSTNALDFIEQYNDIGGSEATRAVQYLTNQGVIEGYGDKTFRPEQSITRAEFLKIALYAYEKNTQKKEVCTAQISFPDVSPNAWYYDVVCRAVELGVVQGYPDGSFRPNDTINYAEASKVVNIIAETERNTEVLGDWYAQYITYLSGEKVVPNTIESAEKELTRGEMSQIIWGLQTGNEVGVDETNALIEMEICAHLNTQIDKFMKRNGGYGIPGHYLKRSMDMPMMMESMEMMEDSAVQSAGATTTGGDFSTTNTQEAGVDEADIVKTNGKYLFVIKHNTLRIIDIQNTQALAQVSVMNFGKNMMPRDIYVEGNTLIVMASRYDENIYPVPYIEDMNEANNRIAGLSIRNPGTEKTIVQHYDVSNPSTPELSASYEFLGNMSTSRKIGDEVYIVLNENIPLWGNNKPLYTDENWCGTVRYIPNFEHANFVHVAKINLKQETQEQTTLLGASAGQVYSSAKNVYITQQTHRQWNHTGRWAWQPRTIIHQVHLDDLEYTGSGITEGYPINQFAMSESSDGHFRIATQRRDEATASQITIFSPEMKRLSSLGNIAPGEDMKSVRFMGDRAYMVTFEQVDPLFVIDLDPQNPIILGELKIPGWSDYLHPWTENTLIGFGRDVSPEAETKERLTQEDLLGLKLSLFDVSQVDNPKELHVEILGGRGSSSDIAWNHKVLTAEPNLGYIAFPVTLHKAVPGSKWENKFIFNGAQVWDVSSQNGFTLRGSASHYPEEVYNSLNSIESWEANISRIIRISNSFVAVSHNYISTWTEENLAPVDRLELDIPACNTIYTAWECENQTACTTVYRDTNICRTNPDGTEICSPEREFLTCEAR